MDDLDRRLIATLAAQPRAGVLTLARMMGVNRNTVQARLDKLVARGIITGFGPDVSLKAVGYDVLAFVTLEIAQGRTPDVLDHLRDIPEVVEAHMVTGMGDLFLRVVARSNEDLARVINRILEIAGINRTTTLLALSTPIPTRTLPAIQATADP
ncbi:MAG TPA: Lrp/AsnC family transcriptional regulator [Acidimicrobiales bacterium]|nr:Lrp/AsnC family transcriptional regulator [Acidimicrobiales bacterium]